MIEASRTEAQSAGRDKSTGKWTVRCQCWKIFNVAMKYSLSWHKSNCNNFLEFIKRKC